MRSGLSYLAMIAAGAMLAPLVMAAPGEGHLFAGIVHEAPYFAPGVTSSFATPSGQGDAVTAELRAAMVMPITCTAGQLRAALQSSDGTYTAATVTVLLNGGATALTCSLAGIGSTCSDVTHTFAVAAGDRIALQISPNLPQRPITNDDTEIKVKVPFSWRCTE